MNTLRTRDGQELLDTIVIYVRKMMIEIADHINDNGLKWNKSDSWGSGKNNTERIVDEFLEKPGKKDCPVDTEGL